MNFRLERYHEMVCLVQNHVVLRTNLHKALFEKQNSKYSVINMIKNLVSVATCMYGYETLETCLNEAMNYV